MWNYKRGRKYNNKTTEYNGRKYHSKMEAEDAMWLDSLKKEGKILEIIPQFKFSLKVNDKVVGTHIVDFLITLPDGRKKLMETKGFATSEWDLKRKITEAMNPGIPYLVNTYGKPLTEKKLLE